MKEQIVSFETAKLLEKIGFIGFCRNYYNKVGELKEFCYYEGDGTGVNSLNLKDDYLPEDFYILAPTQSLAQKWLREKYHIIVESTFIPKTDELEEFYIWAINYNNDEWYSKFEKAMNEAYQNVEGHYINPEKYKRNIEEYAGGFTYEQALEKGLQEAIKIIRDETKR